MGNSFLRLFGFRAARPGRGERYEWRRWRRRAGGRPPHPSSPRKQGEGICGPSSAAPKARRRTDCRECHEMSCFVMFRLRNVMFRFLPACMSHSVAPASEPGSSLGSCGGPRRSGLFSTGCGGIGSYGWTPAPPPVRGGRPGERHCFARIARGRGRASPPARFARLIARARACEAAGGPVPSACSGFSIFGLCSLRKAGGGPARASLRAYIGRERQGIKSFL